MNSNENNPQKKSLLKIAWGIVSWAMVAVVVVLAVALVGVRILGYTPYAILSPSMTPEYPVGALVYVKECPPEQIKVGDVLTYVANEDLLVVTHRVVSIDRENRSFITQGDVNKDPDPPVIYENVIGTVRFSIPQLGYVSTYFTSSSGRYVGLAVIFGLLLLMLLPELFKKDKQKQTGE